MALGAESVAGKLPCRTPIFARLAQHRALAPVRADLTHGMFARIRDKQVASLIEAENRGLIEAGDIAHAVRCTALTGHASQCGDRTRRGDFADGDAVGNIYVSGEIDADIAQRFKARRRTIDISRAEIADTARQRGDHAKSVDFPDSGKVSIRNEEIAVCVGSDAAQVAKVGIAAAAIGIARTSN